MRIAAHSNKLETNIEVQSQEFGIGDASVVIEILRNRLYQHKVRTLVQEYICNARDAHREIDNPAPIEVTVPNSLSPLFKVRDFGPGVSPDRMQNVFIMYGASTKRANNKQTGGFGIGAKSAWSYTDAFTIITHIDGTRRTYVAHTGVSNNGRLDLISTDKTDEPNGTEIQIAVKAHDIEEFIRSIFRAVYFWAVKPKFKGSVDIQDFVNHKGTKIGNHFEAISGLPGYLNGRSYDPATLVVIDGIPYAIDRELIQQVESLIALRRSCYGRDIAIYIGNGILEVSASREQLTDSEQTIKNLEKLCSKILAEVKTYISEEFKKVSNVAEFLETYSRMSKEFTVEEFAIFGQYKIEQGFIKGPYFETVRMEYVSNRSRNATGVVSKRRDKTSLQMNDYGRVYYCDAPESAIITGRRFRTLLAANPQEFTLLSKTDVTDLKAYRQLIKDLKAIDLRSVPQTKGPKTQRVKRQLTEICGHIPCKDRQYTETIRLNELGWIGYVYTSMSDGMFDIPRQKLAELRTYLEETHKLKLIGLANQVANKIKGLPEFQSLDEYLKAFTPAPKDILGAKQTLAENITPMSAIVNGPSASCKFIAKMQKEYGKVIARKGPSMPGLLSTHLMKVSEVQKFVDDDKKLTDQLKSKYRLLSRMDQYTLRRGEEAEWIAYINAKV